MQNDQPIFKPIFGDSWEGLPLSLKKHYANRPYSNDVVELKGFMDIKMSVITRLMKPLFKIFGALVPYEGENIPTTVYSKSEPNTGDYNLERHFNFEGQNTYVFRSRFIHLKNSNVIEVMKFGIGWRCDYLYNGHRVLLLHKGYYLRLWWGVLLPIPLALLIGKGNAWEEAINENSFRMCMTITHPIFGKTFEYKGQFDVI